MSLSGGSSVAERLTHTMKLDTIKITNIFAGWQSSDYFGEDGQFLGSVAIDPDMPVADSDTKPSGLIRPTSMAKFSSTEVTGVPVFFVSNPKDTNTYLYANDGKVHTVASDLTMGTALNSGNAITTATGNGMAYYDNNLYIARNADIAQYGALDGTPSLDIDYWTNVLSLTALVDTTYPSINGVEIPNHVMHRHTDDKLYICDVLSSNKGALHYIKTTKTTNEGDTDDGSTHTALDFDYGEYPTTIETFNNDLAVGLIEGTNTTIIQKPAKLAFWNTTDDSYTSVTSVELHDPLITALKNVNGVLYVWSGYASGGCRVSRVLANYTLDEITWLPDVYPPLQGAVDHAFGRVVFGTNTAEPEISGSVFAMGGKAQSLGMGVHNIIRASGTGNNPWVTAVKYIDQGSGKIVQPIIGYDDDTNKGLDKISTTYGDYNIFRSERYRIGRNFSIDKISIPFAQAVAANMTLVVKVVSNNGNDSDTIRTINNTNNGGDTFVDLYPQNEYKNDFYLQLEWSGSALLTVSLPINIDASTNG